jgi:hypothetical protein
MKSFPEVECCPGYSDVWGKGIVKNPVAINYL